MSLMTSGSWSSSRWASAKHWCAFSNCPRASSDLPEYFHAKGFSGDLWTNCWQAFRHFWWSPADTSSWMVCWSTECHSPSLRSDLRPKKRFCSPTKPLLKLLFLCSFHPPLQPSAASILLALESSLDVRCNHHRSIVPDAINLTVKWAPSACVDYLMCFVVGVCRSRRLVERTRYCRFVDNHGELVMQLAATDMVIVIYFRISFNSFCDLFFCSHQMLCKSFVFLIGREEFYEKVMSRKYSSL